MIANVPSDSGGTRSSILQDNRSATATQAKEIFISQKGEVGRNLLILY